MATRELLLFVIHLSQMTGVPIMIHNAQWKLYDQVSRGRQILNWVSMFGARKFMASCSR